MVETLNNIREEMCNILEDTISHLNESQILGLWNSWYFNSVIIDFNDDFILSHFKFVKRAEDYKKEDKYFYLDETMHSFNDLEDCTQSPFHLTDLSNAIANREVDLDKIEFIEVKRIADVIFEIEDLITDLITILENGEYRRNKKKI